MRNTRAGVAENRRQPKQHAHGDKEDREKRRSPGRAGGAHETFTHGGQSDDATLMISFPSTRSRRPPSTAAVIAGLVVLAALVRFPTLGAKSYWGDEISTLFLVRHSFGGMFAGVARLESTPPLYYALAKVWYAVAGGGEEGMRALPAMLGVATVPVAYAATNELVSRRAATIAAALIAVNPMLVWYSGEARAYSLAVLLSAVGLWCFARALHGRRRAVAGWAVASALALATHYFSVFLIVPEAVVLLRRNRVDRRPLLLALTAVGCAGAALLPLALEQRSFGHAAWIQHTSLPFRIVRAPVDLLVGFDAPGIIAVGVLAVILAAAGGWLAWRRVRAPVQRRGVALMALVAAACIALPALAAVFGLDYFDSRNVVVALVPLTIAVAAGYSALRGVAATATAATVCGLFIGVVAATATEPKYHSEDWRAAAHALGDDGTTPRAVIVTPGQAGRKPLMVYLGEGTQPVWTRQLHLAEVDLVIAPSQGASHPAPGAVRELESLRIRSFHRVARNSDGRYVVIRLRARRPHLVSLRAITLRLGRLRPAALLQR